MTITNHAEPPPPPPLTEDKKSSAGLFTCWFLVGGTGPPPAWDSFHRMTCQRVEKRRAREAKSEQAKAEKRAEQQRKNAEKEQKKAANTAEKWELREAWAAIMGGGCKRHSMVDIWARTRVKEAWKKHAAKELSSSPPPQQDSSWDDNTANRDVSAYTGTVTHASPTTSASLPATQHAPSPESALEQEQTQHELTPESASEQEPTQYE
ncbi:hypothetical protein B0H66DRAFT_527674 [Apodospora peruviana]|uniref:Uncharacterized protein n=1 Tax=Apodospora peruviana TaxID=516989 RepID=A0AAE0ISG0_9PEZI|nr:hypothetical protein B0H66DRAFT_527674 [Apodospora peruviana]